MLYQRIYWGYMYEERLKVTARGLAAQRFRGDTRLDLGFAENLKYDSAVEKLAALGCKFSRSRQSAEINISIDGLKEPILKIDIRAANRNEINAVELLEKLEDRLNKSTWLREKLAMPRKEISDEALRSMMFNLFKKDGAELHGYQVAKVCRLDPAEVSAVLGTKVRGLPTKLASEELDRIGAFLQAGAKTLGGEQSAKIFSELFSEFKNRVESAKAEPQRNV
jgi:hypothetical protein